MDVTTQAETPIDQASLLRRLADARNRLIDRNLRNRLISTPLESARTKSIRVFGELSDQVFSTLVSAKRPMRFVPLDDGSNGESASETDNTDGDGELSYEITLPNNGNRQSDEALQTNLTNSALSKRLLSTYYESRDYEEEQGVNVLYLACGFLRWFEDATSTVARYAPLVLIPVELTRQTGKGGGFSLRVRDDEFLTNISLKVWIKEQFSIDLPELPEEEEWSPSSYFDRVEEILTSQPRWEVLRNEILLGFFSFSKFLLWRDLDPATWPEGKSLAEHPLIQKLLKKPSERPELDPPLFPPEESLDRHFTPRDLVYVLDADPSQTEAIQTALTGRDMVIQGPPGTGKSQTITNLIAAAIATGKSVLFIAEKMAALEVVHSRLTKAGVSEICLELHSRKANKKSIHEQLKVSLDLPPQPTPPMAKVDELEKLQGFLNDHSSRVNSPLEPWGFKPYDLIGRICLLHSDGTEPLAKPIPNSASYDVNSLALLEESISDLCGRLRASGYPALNPWVEGKFNVLTPLASERIAKSIRRCLSIASEVRTQLEAISIFIHDLEPSLLSLTRADLDQHLDLSTLAKKFPAVCPISLAQSATLYLAKRKVSDLASDLAFYAEHQDFIERSIAKVWRSIDIESLRFRYRASGGSVFSIFNSTYRQASREIAALATVGLPKSYNDRLALLDKLISFEEAEKNLSEIDPDLAVAFGEFWDGIDTSLSPIVGLVKWYETTNAIGSKGYQISTRLASNSEMLEIALEVHEKRGVLHAELDHLAKSLEIDPVHFDGMSFVNLERCLHAFDADIDRINYWPPTREKLQELRPVIGDEMHDLIWYGAIPIEKVSSALVLTVCEALWTEYVKALPELGNIDAYQLNETLQEFRLLDVARSKIAAAEIKSSYARRVPAGNSGEMGILRAELIKKSRHKSLRKLMNEAGGAIQKLKPVFLMSPLSVAQYLQPGSLMFDIVVIDEASQIRPEDALGAIARGKQVVVVGDQRQLPPTNFFNRLISDEDEVTEEDEFAISDMESILSLGEISLSNHCMLTWHYRSLHPGLIAVSNRNFYENRLKLPPSIMRSSYSEGMGVSMIKSPPNSYERGGSQGGRNVAEAELIASEVIAFARAFPNKSLGVAAFSVKQRDLIRELVEIQFTKNPDLKEFFSDGRPEPFFVKNLESIQGDERDAIFISVGYGRSADGMLRKSFGPLALAGGERRLNVLISRAKERVTVFSSITADDFKAEPGKLGLNAFREFLQYAEKGYFDAFEDTQRDFDSDFEESVAIFLREKGYSVNPQVGMSGFFIDLGVVHPDKPESYLCGIECDGATYHSSRSARERDRLRQGILESRGWKIYRIWSTDWFYRRADQEKQLIEALQTMRTGLDIPSSTAFTSSTLDEDSSPVSDRSLSSSNDTSGATQPNTTAYSEYSVVRTGTVELHMLPAFEIDKVVSAIVREEGPIHELEVSRRLARVFGLQRAGSRIQEIALKSLRRISAVTSNSFWRYEDLPVKVRDRSAVSSTTLQKPEMIPPEEILEAAADLVRSSVRIRHDELVVAISRKFGFQRCGEELSSRIGGVLKGSQRHSFSCDINGTYFAND